MDEKVLGKTGLAYLWAQLTSKFVQSDWNQNDDTQLDHVKNRPIYDYEGLGDTLNWDGVETAVTGTDGTNTYYKVSDVVLTASDCVGTGSYTKTAIDGSSSESSDANLASSFYEDGSFCIYGYVYGVPTANYDDGYGGVFPEAGIYLAKTSSYYVSEFVVPGHTGLIGIQAKKLDPKYLDGSLVRSGTGTFAEVFNNLDASAASGSASHAEGQDTQASGVYSHAQNYAAKATGYASHAEGQSSKASGSASHAEGYYTRAAGKYQHAQGKWNVEDTEDRYAHIVGNGTQESARSNAHTLDWDGNAWFAGNVRVGGTSYDDASSMASTNLYTATVGTTWTAVDTGGYSQTVTVTGMLETDTPIADIVMGDDTSLHSDYTNAWACITRITTAADSITLYADSELTTEFTVQLRVIR